MYHTDKIAPIESNMAGPHGDISNSNRQEDLPICSKTYTVYDYNYQRGVAEAVENHMHQIEAVLNFVDYDMFWNKFVNPYGKPDGVNHCGWTHFPPNGKSDYDWLNISYAQSDCEDWRPEGGGAARAINCLTWSGYMYPDSSSCVDNGGLAFKIWWMQNIPGKDNGLTYQGKELRNW